MIKVNNLSVSYYGNKVIDNINFEFDKGSIIGIIGPNGAGKSTMIKAILGLINKDSGQVTIGGQDIEYFRKDLAYLPQRSDLDWDFPIDVFGTVLMGTYPRLGLFKKPKDQEKLLAKKCLEKVDMYDYRYQQIGELSGGQQQRVFLARALTQEADFFFLDEPFVGIDANSEKQIINILRDLKKQGKTVFVVHHDLSKVEDYFDDLILINKEIIKAGTVEEVFTYEKMAKAYESEVRSPLLKAVAL